MTKMLAEAGYTCGLSGKLHLSACHPSVCEATERRIDDGYSELHWSHHAGGGWGEKNEYWAWLRRKGSEFSTQEHPDSHHVRIGMPEELHQTTWCTEMAQSFIADHAADSGPWLFSVNMFDPHHGFDPPEEYLQRYMGAIGSVPLPDYREGELADKPVYQRIDHRGAYGGGAGFGFDEMSDTDHRIVRASYWAMCDLIDAQVGRLISVLDATGQRENTLIVFTSDHGEMLGDHGIYLKGPYFYESAIRVPLIISLPGAVDPRTDQALVELTDLAPTILEAAGIPVAPGMQGRSLWYRLIGKDRGGEHREDVYCEYYNAMPWHRDPTPQMTMIRTDRYKIVVDHSTGDGELYDLQEDPGEHHNLWMETEARNVKGDMLLRLTNCMAWTVDPLPERQSAW